MMVMLMVKGDEYQRSKGHCPETEASSGAGAGG